MNKSLHVIRNIGFGDYLKDLYFSDENPDVPVAEFTRSISKAMTFTDVSNCHSCCDLLIESGFAFVCPIKVS